MEQLEDRIIKYKKGAKKAAIGLGVAAISFTFDYNIADEVMGFAGGYLIGSNLDDSINYIKYHFQRDKSEKSRE